MGLDCERVGETAVCEVHCGFSSVDLSEWRVRARFRCVGRGAGCACSCLSSRLHIRQPDVEQASDLYIQIRLVSAILAERGSRRVSAGRCAGEGEGWPVAHRDEETGRRSVRKSATASPGDSRRLFSLRLKASEYERLRFLARLKGVSMARYLTAQGLTPPVEQVNPEQLRELLGLLRVLCRQVQGEATNINQIAHWANASRRFPAEAEQVARELRRQVDALCEVRAKVSDLL